MSYVEERPLGGRWKMPAIIVGVLLCVVIAVGIVMSSSSDNVANQAAQVGAQPAIAPEQTAPPAAAVAGSSSYDEALRANVVSHDIFSNESTGITTYEVRISLEGGEPYVWGDLRDIDWGQSLPSNLVPATDVNLDGTTWKRELPPETVAGGTSIVFTATTP